VLAARRSATDASLPFFKSRLQGDPIALRSNLPDEVPLLEPRIAQVARFLTSASRALKRSKRAPDLPETPS
jgi:hypothetical protein